MAKKLLKLEETFLIALPESVASMTNMSPGMAEQGMEGTPAPKAPKKAFWEEGTEQFSAGLRESIPYLVSHFSDLQGEALHSKVADAEKAKIPHDKIVGDLATSKRFPEFAAKIRKAKAAGMEDWKIIADLKTKYPIQDTEESDSLTGRIPRMVGQLWGDFGVIMVGVAAGRYTGGPGGAWGGAGALPAGIRKMMLDKIHRGEVGVTSKEFAERLWQVAKEATKQYAVGKLTGEMSGAFEAAGAGTAAKLGAQAATMGTAGAVVDARLPTRRDYEDAAILMFGPHFAAKSLGILKGRTAKMQEANPGMNEAEALERIQTMYKESESVDPMSPTEAFVNREMKREATPGQPQEKGKGPDDIAREKFQGDRMEAQIAGKRGKKPAPGGPKLTGRPYTGEPGAKPAEAPMEELKLAQEAGRVLYPSDGWIDLDNAIMGEKRDFGPPPPVMEEHPLEPKTGEKVAQTSAEKVALSEPEQTSTTGDMTLGMGTDPTKMPRRGFDLTSGVDPTKAYEWIKGITRSSATDTANYVRYLMGRKLFVDYHDGNSLDRQPRQEVDIATKEPKMSEKDMPAITRIQSPSKALGRLFDLGDNPVIDVSQSVMAASKNTLNSRRWGSAVLKKYKIEDSSKDVVAAVKPLIDKYKPQTDAYNMLTDKLRAAKNMVDKTKGHKEQQGRYEGMIKDIQAQMQEMEKGIDSTLGKEIKPVIEALARTHSDVRVYLQAANELPGGIKISEAERKAADAFRQYMGETGTELHKAGIPTLEKGSYMPRMYRALFDDPASFRAFTSSSSVPSILKFVSRLPGTQSWLPSAHAMTQAYIPVAEYKIAFQPFLNRWSPFINTLQHPELKAYMTKWVQDNMYRQTDTLSNKAVNAIVALEYMRIIGGSVSVAVKHLSKQVGTWAHYGTIPTVKAEMEMAKVPVQAIMKRFGLRGEYNELKAFQTYNNIMQFVKLLDEVPGLDAQARGMAWAKIITGNPTIAAEMVDNGVSVFAGIVQGARKGLGYDTLHRQIWEVLLDANFRGGWDQPLWQKDPGKRALSMFQMTPYKLLEYKVGLVEKAIRGDRDAFGTHAATKLARYLVTVGAIVYTARKQGWDTLEWFTHTPFITGVVKQIKEAPYATLDLEGLHSATPPVAQLLVDAAKTGGIKKAVKDHFKDWGAITKTHKAIEGEYNKEIYSSPTSYTMGLKNIESKYTQEAILDKMDLTEQHKDEYKHLDAMVDRFLQTKNGEDRKRVVDYVAGKKEEDHDRLNSHIDRYVRTAGVPDRKWWMTLMSMTPEMRAEQFVRRYKDTKDPQERARMIRLADNIKGFATEKYLIKLEELKGGSK